MRINHHRSPLLVALTMLVTACLVAQPVLAQDGLTDAGEPAVGDQSAQLAAQQAQIALRLEKIGRDQQQAAEMAAQLTAQDLEVLLANPDMLQPAGADRAVWTSIIVGALLLAAILALAAAGDGGLSIN